MHTSVAMPMCTLGRTDQYLDMYASRIEDHSKIQRSDHYTDTYASRHQDRMKTECGTQQLCTDMYGSRGDELTKLSSGMDCDMYTSCHADLQAGIMSPYSGEPLAGRGVPMYSGEHGEPIAGRGVPLYGVEPLPGREVPVYSGEHGEPAAGRGLSVYTGEHGEPAAGGVPVYSNEQGEPTTARGVPLSQYGATDREVTSQRRRASSRFSPYLQVRVREPVADGGMPLYNGEHGEPAAGRGASEYSGDHGEPTAGGGVPVYSSEQGEPTTGRGAPLPQYSATDGDVTSQGGAASSRPVPYIQVRVGDPFSFLFFTF